MTDLQIQALELCQIRYYRVTMVERDWLAVLVKFGLDNTRLDLAPIVTLRKANLEMRKAIRSP